VRDAIPRELEAAEIWSRALESQEETLDRRV